MSRLLLLLLLLSRLLFPREQEKLGKEKGKGKKEKGMTKSFFPFSGIVLLLDGREVGGGRRRISPGRLAEIFAVDS